MRSSLIAKQAILERLLRVQLQTHLDCLKRLERRWLQIEQLVQLQLRALHLLRQQITIAWLNHELVLLSILLQLLLSQLWPVLRE